MERLRRLASPDVTVRVHRNILRTKALHKHSTLTLTRFAVPWSYSKLRVAKHHAAAWVSLLRRSGVSVL